MDKYEYKVRADEIKALIAEGDYAEAVKIADSIDWRRVKSVMMLCTISDLYKINRRYQESKDILLLAYEKHPTGRLIVYSLCELSIKMEEYVQAIEYYKEFVQIAPKDTGRYILQYRLYEAQEVSLEERIAVLEEFKKRDYREKWAYELAYLYHRIGLTTKCVEECDEMFLWFGEGKYVLKALELKALHTALNADQQKKYDTWLALRDAQIAEEKGEQPSAIAALDIPQEVKKADIQVAEKVSHNEESPLPDEDVVNAPTTELPEVKTVDVGQYNTINLQMALAESMKEILADEKAEESAGKEPEAEYDKKSAKEADEEIIVQNDEEIPAVKSAAHADIDTEEDLTPYKPAETAIEQEAVPVEESVVYSQEEETTPGSITEQIIAPLLQETTEIPKISLPEEAVEIPKAPLPKEAVEVSKASLPEEAVEVSKVSLPKETVELPKVSLPEKTDDLKEINVADTGVLTPLNAKPTKFDNVLSQEYDGQISLVVPDVEQIEKQITGQLSIEDIMAEWEETKKTNEQKRMEDVRRRILEHTGSLFADFDEATKSGLLEQLEKAFVAAIMKSTEERSAAKKVIVPKEAEEEPAEKKETEAVNAVLPEDPLTSEDEVEELAEIEEEPIQSEIEEEPARAETEEKTMAAETEAETEAESAAKVEEEPMAGETAPEETEQSGSVRELTEDEKEIFGQFVHHRKCREQLINTLDNISLASYTGNVIITGEEGSGTLSLAKGLIREVQYNDSNFSGQVAKVTGEVLNKKNVPETFARLSNGALIIEAASNMNGETAERVSKTLQKDNTGLILILEDTKKNMNGFLEKNPFLTESFNLRVDIESLDDEALVAYAKQYAEQMEYSIDEFGVLALHTRIADMQTSDHEVNVAEVRGLVNEAIYYANKKTPGHFLDILLAKRYDANDMIILREKDFMHY